MNKMMLIDELAIKEKITREESRAIVELFFETIANTLVSGDRVEIRGLCTFSIKNYKGYNGRNPKTGESTKVKSKKLPFFKCGIDLKNRVDYK